MARFRQVLSNRNFFCLWIGQIISQFGDRLNQMALIALIYQKSPGSTVELAKLILFIIIPVFIIGPIAGVYADRWDRKRIMIVSDLLRGCLVLLIPLFLIRFKSNLPIYLVVFLIFSVTRFFLPSKMAIIPSVVPRDQLLVANSLSDTTRMIATVVSLGLAGVLVKLVGVTGSFYVDSLTFFVSAGFLSAITVKSAMPTLKDGFLAAERAIKSAIKISVFRDIKNGFKYFIELKNMRFVASIFFILMSGLGAVFCVIIVFIQNSFGTATRDLGLLGMFLGIGLFIGAVAYGRLGHRLVKSRVIFTNLAASGIGVIIFAVLIRTHPSFFLASMCSFIIGVFVGPIVVSSNTLVHEVLPEDARGRVFSSLEVVTHVGFLICMLAASVLAEFVGRAWILVFVGSVFAACGVSGLFLKTRKG